MSVATSNPVQHATDRNPLYGGLASAYYRGNGSSNPVSFNLPAGRPAIGPGDVSRMNFQTPQNPETSTASKQSNYIINYPRFVMAETRMRHDEFNDLQPQSLVFTSYNPHFMPSAYVTASQEICQVSGLTWINHSLRDFEFDSKDALKVDYSNTYADSITGTTQAYADPPWSRILKAYTPDDPISESQTNLKKALEVLEAWRLDGVLLTSELTEHRNVATETNMPIMFNVGVKGRALVRNGNESEHLYAVQGETLLRPYSSKHQFDEKVRCGHGLYVGVHLEYVSGDLNASPSTAKYVYQLKLWSSRTLGLYSSQWDTSSKYAMAQTRSLMTLVGAWRVGTVVDSRASVNRTIPLSQAESIQVEAYIDCKWMDLTTLKQREATVADWRLSYMYMAVFEIPKLYLDQISNLTSQVEQKFIDIVNKVTSTTSTATISIEEYIVVNTFLQTFLSEIKSRIRDPMKSKLKELEDTMISIRKDFEMRATEFVNEYTGTIKPLITSTRERLDILFDPNTSSITSSASISFFLWQYKQIVVLKLMLQFMNLIQTYLSEIGNATILKPAYEEAVKTLPKGKVTDLSSTIDSSVGDPVEALDGGKGGGRGRRKGGRKGGREGNPVRSEFDDAASNAMPVFVPQSDSRSPSPPSQPRIGSSSTVTKPHPPTNKRNPTRTSSSKRSNQFLIDDEDD